MRVLLVQSELQAAQALSRSLEERGDEVWQTDQLEEAYALLDLIHPQLLLVDIHFSELDWEDFLAHARLSTPEIKFIATSRYPNLNAELKAQQSGVSVFLRQPFTRFWVERALERLQIVEPAQGHLHPKKRFTIPLWLRTAFLLSAMSLLVIIAAIVVTEYSNQESIKQSLMQNVRGSGLLYVNWLATQEKDLMHSLDQISGTLVGTVTFDEHTSDRFLPLLIENKVDALDILDANSATILSIRKTAGDSSEYSISQAQSDLAQHDFTRTILQGIALTRSEVIQTPSGTFFYVGRPLLDRENRIIGVLLIGRSLGSLAAQLKVETQAEVSFYSPVGVVIQTTFNPSTQDLSYSLTRQILMSSYPIGYGHNFSWNENSFYGIIVPWVSGNGHLSGLMSVAYPLPLQTLHVGDLLQPEYITLALVALIMVFLVSYYLLKHLSEPLKDLRSGLNEIIGGNLGIKLDPHDPHEFSGVLRTFNAMVATLQERLLFHDLLAYVVKPKLLEDYRSAFQAGKFKLAGKSYDAALLLVFMSQPKDTPSELWLDWANELFNDISPVIEEAGGYVDVFDGYCIKAAFGILPESLPLEVSVKNACNVGINLAQIVKTINTRRRKRGEPCLPVEFLIHSGRVVAGGLGVRDRLRYVLIGEVVDEVYQMRMALLPSTTTQILISQKSLPCLGEPITDYSIKDFSVPGLYLLTLSS